jgi:5'/3'-nucleotidase SurE
MRVLITNDDGIEAPGIRWLARAVVREGYDVVVAAPLTEASGSSADPRARRGPRRAAGAGEDPHPVPAI